MRAEGAMDDQRVERLWETFLTEGQVEDERRQRRFFRLLPGTPRCNNCYAPSNGPGSAIARVLYGKQRSNLNPHLCNLCERFAREYQGGAHIELSLVFADVRGSTKMAEQMEPRDFTNLINRFYDTATRIMVRSDALIDKIIGDQVAAMYVPGFAGPDHARVAVEAARKILRATGHDRPEGPWIPLGAGVHTGEAFVGSVHYEEGTADITVLGDTPNTAARLASRANEGEILVSDASCQASELDFGQMEARSLEVKGKGEPVPVHVLN